MSFPVKLKRDIMATYVAEMDCTVVWQYIYLEEVSVRNNLPDRNHEPIQQTIVGWYHGEPDADATKRFSESTMIADYYFPWR